ncbi:PP2C family protein-serine/threonine phosphatase [Streptomyces formicae]|uniref:SpoIIE family protein phosphatase n=1 Tax=Streptomyces formicae TaxID=1616117 RepID=A0ABY3WN81_9ACTN|nr:SpoIIE family protein phosphatase [Streptomyces formicae]UNM12252.1 SpoIIE family protein phosphatase [Streptomyces formicae]
MEPSIPRLRVSVSRIRLLPADGAVAHACVFVRAQLAQRAAAHPGVAAFGEQLIEAAALRAGELVSHAVAHACSEVELICRIEDGRDTGTEVEVICRIDDGRWPLPPLPVNGRTTHRDKEAALSPALERQAGEEGEVTDLRPTTLVEGAHTRSGTGSSGPQRAAAPAEYSMRIHLRAPADQAQSPAVPAGADGHRLPTMGPQAHTYVPDRPGHGAPSAEPGPSFLAEASELLAGQLDEDLVAALAGQLLVPRVGDWCGVWLSSAKGRMRLARVWHADERLVEPLRELLERNTPSATLRAAGRPLPHISPDAGMAWAFPLVVSGSCHGVLVLGSTDHEQADDRVVRQVENMARLLAQAVATARQYARQTTISRALQSRQLPTSLPQVPGLDTAVVYEPHEEAQTVGGDFYDLFRKRDGRWCFLLGDVQGKDPEAMSITGLARHMVRLLAREGHSVESVLERLNVALTEDGAEAATPGVEHTDGRFLTLLYGELEPDAVAGGVHVRLASAGHPLPLKLFTNGTVEPAAQPQLLLGVDRNAQYSADCFELMPGEVMLCVTDGVTERRRGKQQFDDDGSLAQTLSQCSAMSAMAVANHVRQAVHDFGTEPVEDDLAVLVLKALPPMGMVKLPRSRIPSD